MTPTPQGISLGLVRLTWGVDEGEAPSLVGRVGSRSMGIKFIEELVEKSNDSEFDNLEDLDEGPDLGLGEDPDPCSITYAANTREYKETLSSNARDPSPYGIDVA